MRKIDADVLKARVEEMEELEREFVNASETVEVPFKGETVFLALKLFKSLIEATPTVEDH